MADQPGSVLVRPASLCAMQATVALLPLHATLGERCPQADRQRWHCSCCAWSSESTGSRNDQNTIPKNHNRSQAFSALPADAQGFRSGVAD